MARGAPLRFMGVVLGGWTVVRVALLWPAELPIPDLHVTTAEATVAVTGRAATPAMTNAVHPAAVGRDRASQPVAERQARLADLTIGAPGGPAATAAVIPTTAAIVTGNARRDLPPLAPDQVATPPMVPRIAALPRNGPSRLAGDSWLSLRPGGGDSLAFGQLGASQAGPRLTYALDEARHVALSARLSAPINGAGREAGIGIDIRPTGLPIHVLVEGRFDLDGGVARPAVVAIAGMSAALPVRARLDTYAQAGAVGRRGGFVDGAALISRPLLERGSARLELGGGAWGAAQRRVARFDVGPSIALVAPAGRTSLRLQLDYRARIAGRARPGSGPALTLGGSF